MSSPKEFFEAVMLELRVAPPSVFMNFQRSFAEASRSEVFLENISCFCLIVAARAALAFDFLSKETR